MRKIVLLLFIIQLTGMHAQCFLKEVPSYGTRLETTGSGKLDKILIDEALSMIKNFNVQVNLYAYDDASSPNAVTIPSYSVIMMGKTLMLDELANTYSANSIIAIMAHEFAHLLQAKYQLNKNGGWIGKYPELHADFLAGWYIGKKKYLDDNEIKNIAESFWNKGDANYYNIDHHGTKYERKFAFMHGFECSNMLVDDAYEKGAKLIANIDSEINKGEEKFYNQSVTQDILKDKVTEDKSPGYVTFKLHDDYKKGKIFIQKDGRPLEQRRSPVMFSDGYLICDLKRKKINMATFVLPTGNYLIRSEAVHGLDLSISYQYFSVAEGKTTVITTPFTGSK